MSLHLAKCEEGPDCSHSQRHRRCEQSCEVGGGIVRAQGFRPSDHGHCQHPRQPDKCPTARKLQYEERLPCRSTPNQTKRIPDSLSGQANEHIPLGLFGCAKLFPPCRLRLSFEGTPLPCGGCKRCPAHHNANCDPRQSDRRRTGSWPCPRTRPSWPSPSGTEQLENAVLPVLIGNQRARK